MVIMNQSIVKLKGVSKTLLIPLRARYIESKTPRGIIHDPKSIEILDRIEYDFSGQNEVSKGSQKGVSIRTEILDEQTRVFLAKHKNAIVVNLGCGLDTRYHRLNNGSVIWFDLDLPETIELRKNFFTETDKFKFISKSVLDFSWIDFIPKSQPTLFIAEGLFMYFSEKEVQTILNTIAKNFPRAEILLEAMSPFLTKRTAKHPDMKNQTAVFKWGIKTGKEMNKWNAGAKFINEYYYFDRHKSHQSFFVKILTKIPAFRKMIKIIHLAF